MFGIKDGGLSGKDGGLFQESGNISMVFDGKQAREGNGKKQHQVLMELYEKVVKDGNSTCKKNVFQQEKL